MNKYQVRLSATAIVSTMIEVEADSADEGYEEALQMAHDGRCNWEKSEIGRVTEIAFIFPQ